MIKIIYTNKGKHGFVRSEVCRAADAQIVLDYIARNNYEIVSREELSEAAGIATWCR